MIVISRCKIENGERHVTREVTLSARKSIPPKNNFRGITMGIGSIWGITSLTFILSWLFLCRWLDSAASRKKLFLGFIFNNYSTSARWI